MDTARQFAIDDSKANHEIMTNLDDVKLLRNLAYINGKWVSGAHFRPVFNPANNEIIGYFTQLAASQVSSAIDSAEHAFTAWRQLQADQRGDYLRKWQQLILAAKHDLARLMVLEQGKTLAEAVGEIEYGASFIGWFAEEARRSYGETIPSHIAHAQLFTVREPIGVAGLITPWNFPSAMITRKAAAAMAMGCSVVVKPASETPFSALALAELADRAGIPPGVFNVVTADAKTVANVFCQSDKVKALSFTGSTPIGKQLLRDAADTVKKCSMELGGNAPFIVLPDMDVQQAAQAAAEAKFQTSGQDCLAANRIFVPQNHFHEFVEHFATQVNNQVVGNGLQADCTIGPLVNHSAVEKAQSLLNDALIKGATIVAQANLPPNTQTDGCFFPPTLLVGVKPEMAVYREENFCPIAIVMPYADLEQVITMSNDTEYGLAAYVYGHDIHQIWQCLRGLAFGMVSVNSVKMTGHPIPFGGIKQSGLGREGSKHGFEEFSEIKYCCLGNLPTVSGS